MKRITEEWIKRAEQDFLVAVRELEAQPAAAEAVCFHTQQCIEKYLKAILQENDIEFLKIHDLDILLEQCLPIASELKEHRDEIITISAYAVDLRYPGFDVPEVEAKKSVEMTKKIRKVIRRYFDLPENKE